jgi:hypothetical protein
MGVEVKLMLEPRQTGLLLEAVGVAGVAAAVTTTVPVIGGHPETKSVTPTVYVPALFTIMD